MLRAISTVWICVLLVLAMSVAAKAERRVALVIGNGKYENVPHLPNPAHDAEDVAAALKSLGFETIVAVDLDQAGMQDAAIRFAREARSADVALFYYSGHAMQFAGVNYLMPIDAALDDEADLRRFSRVDDFIADLQLAKNLRILVLDSCRDNPLAEALKRSANRNRGTAPIEAGLARVDSPQGMIVAFSTQAGRTADDGIGRNSPYTAAFLDNIGKNEEIGLVFRGISEQVFETTKQQQLPELSLSLIGRFYLGGEPAAAPKQKPDAAGGRLELALVADDPANAAGAPLRQFGDPEASHAIERSITFPGDIESIAVVGDQIGGVGLDIAIAAPALERINADAGVVGRQIALVLDGRTVLSVAVLREPLASRIMLSGNFSMDEIQRLVGAIITNE